MTNIGKITKYDLIDALIDYAIPNDVKIPHGSGGNYDSFKNIVYNALTYDHTTKDVYFDFCKKAGLLPKIREEQKNFIIKENIMRDLQNKATIKFEPKDDYSDMI